MCDGLLELFFCEDAHCHVDLHLQLCNILLELLQETVIWRADDGTWMALNLSLHIGAVDHIRVTGEYPNGSHL